MLFGQALTKRRKPMAGSEQGVFLYTPSVKTFEFLPEFLIYRKCAKCKKKHFYITDFIRLTDKAPHSKASVRLTPSVRIDVASRA